MLFLFGGVLKLPLAGAADDGWSVSVTLPIGGIKYHEMCGKHVVFMSVKKTKQ